MKLEGQEGSPSAFAAAAPAADGIMSLLCSSGGRSTYLYTPTHQPPVNNMRDLYADICGREI